MKTMMTHVVQQLLRYDTNGVISAQNMQNQLKSAERKTSHKKLIRHVAVVKMCAHFDI
jgi:hypothetical protein